MGPVTLHITNCSSCGPEDGLLHTETCPVNFILDTLDTCVVFDGLQYNLIVWTQRYGKQQD